jgi:gliding motility-associated-like protein
MKYILFIVFFSMSLLTLAQQTFELCAGESKTVVYTSESGGDGTNVWLVNGTQYLTNDLTYTFTNSGTYNIVLRRENGLCYVEQTLQVVVTDCPGVIYWVPNCFTPDENEVNQQYGPVMSEGYDINGFNFTIFNRWGEVVWESNDPNGRWDGTFNNKMCTDGVYIWKLTFNVFNNDGKITNHGHLTIIR